MPDRIRARVAVTALLLLLTVAGIQSAGPHVGWNQPSHHLTLAVAGALEATLAGLLVVLRWRRPAVTAELRTVGSRLRPILSGVIIAGLIAVPLLTLMLLIGKWRNNRRVTQLPRPPTRKPGRIRPGPLDHPTSALAIAHDVFVGLLILAAIAAAIVIWRYWRGLRRLPRLVDDDDDQIPDIPADLARAVGSGQTALRELDDARAAIVRCYLAMEGTLAEAGAARDLAETPDELLARAVAAGLIHAAPAGRLTALFYEARFSTHPMPPSRRDDAEQALAELAASLPGDPGQQGQAGEQGWPAAQSSPADA